jgi:hypothetical protein
MRPRFTYSGNDIISNDIADMPIFPYYYSLDMAVLYGGVDGQKYEVANPIPDCIISSLMTRKAPKPMNFGS